MTPLPTRSPALLSRRTLLKTALSSPVLSLPLLSGPVWGQTITSGATASIGTNGLGIILVGASWCPYCHGAAQQLGVASQQWGWPVLVAALDNQPIEPFEHVLDASTHPLTKEINRLPTTLIVNPTDDHIVFAFEGYTGPVAYLSKIANTLEAWEAQNPTLQSEKPTKDKAHG